MKSVPSIGLKEVQAVYSGPEGDLWELIMGEQVHIGGFESSMDLADRAGIEPGWNGVDFCCCSGAGMRFLVRFRAVASMTGVDATEKVVVRGKERTAAEGLSDKVRFVLADVCDSGLPGAGVDFVWGEDAWCYVEDKNKLIAEAVRLVRPGGTVAFTDWVEGPAGLSGEEAERFMRFMKFPNIQTIGGYSDRLASEGCRVVVAENTGRFAPCVDLYVEMLTKQLTFDALKVIGWDMHMMGLLGGEMAFTQELAQAGKIVQAIFVAKKP